MLDQKVILSRDCEALLIPTAIPITIPSGTIVQISQSMGGSFTVHVSGNLARIEGKDADALGLDPIVASDLPELVLTEDGVVLEEDLWAQLKTCYDPEIPVNIVDLGLVYECRIEAREEEPGQRVHVQMTLTAPGCSMGPVLASDVEMKLRQVPNVAEVVVELVFDPPWTQERMSEAAKLELGLL